MPVPLQMWVIENDIGELNKAFTMGFYACLTPAGMEGGISMRPGIAKQCARLAELRKNTAKWTIGSRFVDRKGLKAGGDGFFQASVFIGENKAAVIIAETGNKKADVKLEFMPEQLGIRSEQPGVLYYLDGKIADTQLPVNGVHTLDMTLEPYDAAVWTFNF